MKSKLQLFLFIINILVTSFIALIILEKDTLFIKLLTIGLACLFIIIAQTLFCLILKKNIKAFWQFCLALLTGLFTTYLFFFILLAILSIEILGKHDIIKSLVDSAFFGAIATGMASFIWIALTTLNFIAFKLTKFYKII